MGRPQIILTSTNKTASFTVFVVCGWREEAVAGVCLRTYLVHSTYVFLVMYQGYDILFYREAHCTLQYNKYYGTATTYWYILSNILQANFSG